MKARQAEQRRVSGEYRLDAPRRVWLRILNDYPKDLPYTFEMACLSARLDIDELGEMKSIRQYVSLWRWSKGRVEDVLPRIRAEIESWGVRVPPKIDRRGGKRTPKEGGDKREDKTGTKIEGEGDKKRAKKSGMCNNGDKNQSPGGQKGDKQGDTYYTPPSHSNSEETAGAREGVSDGGEPSAGSGIDVEPAIGEARSIDHQLASNLWNLIRRLDPGARRPNLAGWAEEIYQIHAVDGRTYPEIDRIIRWAMTDRFWRSLILDPAALRKQFSKLVIQSKPEEEENAGKRKSDRPAGGGKRSGRKATATGTGVVDRATFELDPEEVASDIRAMQGIVVGDSGVSLG